MFGFGSNPQGNQDLFAVADLTALGALATLNTLPTGMQVFVVAASLGGAAPGIFFVLRPALPAPVTANGVTIVDTSDDPTRQWVMYDLFTSAHPFLTAKIDLTLTPANNLVVPAMPGLALCTPLGSNTLRIVVTDFAGTVTTGPTYNAGNNAGENNIAAATTPTAASLNTPAASGAPFTAAATATPEKVIDLATQIRLDVTVGATGVGLTLKGKFLFLFSLRLMSDFA